MGSDHCPVGLKLVVWEILNPKSQDPNKLCLPCCGVKPPIDWDPNLKKIQQFFKLQGSKDCKVDVDTLEGDGQIDKNLKYKKVDEHDGHYKILQY